MTTKRKYQPLIHYLIGAVTIVLPLFFNALSAQTPDTLWTKTFGGSSDDRGNFIQQTLDGGYIITGNTQSYGAGNSDFWLIKTDASGDTIWTKTFGGNNDDFGKYVQQSSDGGYIITGYTKSSGAGDYDVWLIKTDALGDTVWTKTFGGVNKDQGYSVQQTFDGGYIITGYTQSYGAGNYDVWLIKTDALGDTVWTKTFGGTNYDRGYSVEQNSDGGYIITGNTKSYGSGNYDIWLIKTDALGNTVWTKTFGGSSLDIGNSVKQTLDGGYVIVGYTDSYGAGSSDLWLIKTDALGDTIWTKTFGGNSSDLGYSVQQTLDGGYIICGYTNSYGAGSSDVWLIKTDSSGSTLWENTFGGNGLDYGYSVQQTSDEGYIVTGYTGSYGAGSFDAWLIRIESHIPYPPQNLNATAGNQEVTLSWSPNTEPDLHKYNIYRDISSPATTLIDSVIAGTPWDTTYFDPDLINGQTYYYRITAIDNDGNESEFSNEVSITPISREVALSDTLYNFSNVQIDTTSEWTFYIKNVGTDTLTISNITYSLTVYSLSVISGQIDPSDSLGINVSFTPPDIQNYVDTLKIFSNDSDTEDSLKFVFLFGTGIDTLSPDFPKNVVAFDSVQTIKLMWDASPEGDLYYYNIYRSESSDFSPDSIYFKGKVFAPDTTFIDTLIFHNHTYYYKVTAVDTIGNESEPSQYEEVTAIVISVWDISFQQRKDGTITVDIYYSFSGHDTTHYQALPYLSTDNGNTWAEFFTVSGDIGSHVLPGLDKHLTWDIGTEQPNEYYSNAKIKIVVSTTSPTGRKVPLGERELKLERER